MGNFVERKCAHCGNKYKYEAAANFMAFCPRCKKSDASECEYGYGPITPCKIYLGGETIGEVSGDSKIGYGLSVPMLEICQKLGRDPLTEAANIVKKALDRLYGSFDLRTGQLSLHNEVFCNGYTFEQFKKSALYSGQAPERAFTLDGSFNIDCREFSVSLFFKEGRLSLISLCCEAPEISSENEPHRKLLHDAILAEYGISGSAELEWGRISSDYDRKGNVSSILIAYKTEDFK